MIYLSKMVIFHSYVTFPEGKFEVGQVVAFSTTLRSTHFMARHAAITSRADNGTSELKSCA